MARTPLFARIEALARRSAREHPGKGITRRAALAGAGAAVAEMAAGPALAGFAAGPMRTAALKQARIVVVGAGIAGLTTAWQLQQAGYACTVLEATSRVGGRMESDTTTWRNGQVSEHCGELIDSGHMAIRWMAQHFGIKLTNVRNAEAGRATDTFYFEGQYYPQAQAEADFAPVWTALQADLAAADYPTTYNRQTEAGAALDAMSIYEWIDSRVPGGHGSPLGQLLDLAYDGEFGAATTKQSALNIVYLLAFQNDPTHFDIFGQSDERFHMAGGNDQLPKALAADIEAAAPGTIQFDVALTGIRQLFGGGYRLSVNRAGGPATMDADHVVLTLPFSVLRHLDIAQAGFNRRKLNAIRMLGYGSNVKLQLQFNSRLWTRKGPWGVSSGSSYADTGYGNTWEVTRGQPGATGILNNFQGSIGATVSTDSPAPGYVQAQARKFLTKLEPVFPGITAEWNGLATLSAPLRDPWRRGSYAYWKVGQYTTVAGAERERSRTCHFAGEHCSIDFQGYMEGGAQEGMRAARQLVADLQA